ncbi:MAG TPA: hypothetical protein PLN24_07580, partial [Victivallales bacterium]|nr:hypothetical protein [Victivallales bacterium]
MKKSLLTAVSALIFTGQITIQAFDSNWLNISKTGNMQVDNVKISLVHYGKNWKANGQSASSIKPEGDYPKIDEKSWNLKGTFLTADNDIFTLNQNIKKLSDYSILYEASVANQNGIFSEAIALQIEVPVNGMAGREVSVNDDKITLPIDYDENKWLLFSSGNIKKISLPLSSGRLSIEGNYPLLIQDNRKFNGNSYSIRIGMSPSKGIIKESFINLKIYYESYNSTPISIIPQTNMGFADDIADDKKGGWTDQGPENDLRMITAGNKNFYGINFNIINPSTNNGKSCIVLAGPQREYFPKNTEITMNGEKYKNVYLLHALAWAPKEKVPIGKLKFKYQDGSISEAEVIALQDLGDWWTPIQYPNGMLAWTGENKSSYVGLFISKYPIEEKALSSITLESTGKSVWMIVGISASNEDIPLIGHNAPFYIVQGKDWKPIEYPRNIEKNSILDFSFLLDPPAGKYGFVLPKGDRFIFENSPDKSMKFYGVNLCFTANFLEKKQCEFLAEHLAISGYNSVRFHHFDNNLSDKNSPDSTVLDPAQLDKLEYLFYCLKQKGIYITIDLFISRSLKKGEIPEFEKAVGRDFKSLPFVLKSAMENWKRFSANLLNHVNPYTGMAWKDDPALISISLINEDPLISVWDNTPESRKIYKERFQEWLNEKGLSNKENTDEYFNFFLTELYRKGFSEMSSWLRSIGVKAMLSDTNMITSIPLVYCRQDFDYVDNHFYWDHPHFVETPWRLPSSFSNSSVIEKFASVPGSLFPSKILGKPIMITEFNFAYPNSQRAEGGPITGAYASLQGWNALYRFSYAHDSKFITQDAPNTYFDTSVDPLNMLSDKIALLMFLRGDVSEATESIPFLLSEKYYENPRAKNFFPSIAWKTGLIKKVGTIIVSNKTSIPENAIATMGLEKTLSNNLTVPFFDVSEEKEKNIFDEMLNKNLLKGINKEQTEFISSTG